MSGFVDERAARFDGRRHDGRDVDPFQLEADFAPRDPRDIEEIIHESHELRRLPLDHIACPDNFGLFIALHSQNINARPDRGQRISQFVGEHREEFVLLAVCVFQVLVKLGILQSNRRPGRECLGDREVSRTEVPA